MSIVTIFVSLIFLYSLASRRLERTVVTAPILFTAVGMLTYHELSTSQSMPWLPGRETSQGLQGLLHRRRQAVDDEFDSFAR